MTTSYPAGLDSFTNPTATDELDDEIGTRTHSEFHADNNDAIEAIQTELGTDPSGSEATVKARIAAAETATANHLADTADAHAASAITNTAAGNIAATTVQAAINELDTEKLATATAATTYQPLDSDLTAIAALSTTAYGRAVLELANQAALSALVDHGGVAGLSDDDHSQYVLVAGTRSTAQVVLQAGNAAHIPLTVQGTTSQAGNLQQWQNSSGTSLASVKSNGIGYFNAAGLYASAVSLGNITDPNGSIAALQVQPQGAGYVGAIIKGYTAQSANLQQWQNSTGTSLAYILSNGEIVLPGMYISSFQHSSGTGPSVGLSATNILISNRTTTTNVPFTVKGMAAQSGQLQQWQDSSGTTLASVDSAGWVTAPVLVGNNGANLDLNLKAGGTSGSFVILSGDSAAQNLIVDNNGNIALRDAVTINNFGASGFKICGATTQKLGFWGTTPVVQPTAVADATGSGGGDAHTQLNLLLARLRTLGIIAT